MKYIIIFIIFILGLFSMKAIAPETVNYIKPKTNTIPNKNGELYKQTIKHTQGYISRLPECTPEVDRLELECISYTSSRRRK